MQIPIENIYYLLCYAWDKLDEGGRASRGIDDTTELLDLFAKVLINASQILLKRGIDKNYVNHTSDITGVKGKLELNQTIKNNLLIKHRTICSFDDFSANILSNQILVSTIHCLIRTKRIDELQKAKLRNLLRMFIGVERIELKSSLFNQVKLNRNNRFYGFIINICQIIHENLLPSEESGMYTFSDFTRDERKMNQLFEAFVRNFYAIEQSKFKIKNKIIEWQFSTADEDSRRYLPQMKTDITLENDNEKIIIDTKYYTETMTTNYDKEKIKSANLYQLFSYLLNQRNQDIKTMNTMGILLYPTVKDEYNLQFKYYDHNIQIRTINLNANWKEISFQLKQIIK